MGGVPSFYDYSNDHFNPYHYQQTEHGMRQLYAGKYGRHQPPSENPTAVKRDIHAGASYNRFYNHSNLSYLPSQISANSHPNDNSKKRSLTTSDQQQQEGRRPSSSWYRTPDRQGPTLSTSQSPENELPTYGSRRDVVENSHQSQS